MMMVEDCYGDGVAMKMMMGFAMTMVWVAMMMVLVCCDDDDGAAMIMSGVCYDGDGGLL